MVKPVVIDRVAVPDGKGRFLSILQGSGKGRHAFPGGKVERGERPHDAAIRELQEETGLSATSFSLVCQFIAGDRVTFLFAATVDGQIQESEGPVSWRRPKEFLRGKYADLYAKAFECLDKAGLL